MKTSQRRLVLRGARALCALSAIAAAACGASSISDGTTEGKSSEPDASAVAVSAIDGSRLIWPLAATKADDLAKGSGTDAATTDASIDAPASVIDWAFGLPESVAQIAADPFGNYFLEIGISIPFALDDTHILTGSPGGSCSVAKLDASGHPIWVQSFVAEGDGGTHVSTACARIAVDGNGDLYLAGSVSGDSSSPSWEVDFGGGVYVSQPGVGQFGFVVKLDGKSGAGVWAWSYDRGAGPHDSACANVAANGANVALYCTSSQPLTFPMTGGTNETVPLVYPDANIFLASLDSATGRTHWVTAVGATGSKEGGPTAFSAQVADISVDSTGALLATTSVNPNSVLQNASKSINVPAGGVLMRLGPPNGDPLWTLPMDSTTGSILPTSVAVDSNDNIVLGGYARGTINLGTTAFVDAGTVGSNLVAKVYSSDAGIAWVTKCGEQEGTYVTVDREGNTIVSGFSETNVSAGTTTLSPTSQLMFFVIKLDPTGAPSSGHSINPYTADDGGSFLGPFTSRPAANAVTGGSLVITNKVRHRRSRRWQAR